MANKFNEACKEILRLNIKISHLEEDKAKLVVENQTNKLLYRRAIAYLGKYDKSSSEWDEQIREEEAANESMVEINKD